VKYLGSIPMLCIEYPSSKNIAPLKQKQKASSATSLR